MKFLEDGNVDYNIKEIIYFIKNNIDIENIFTSESSYISEFNKSLKEMGWKKQFDFSKKEINHKERQDNWFIPKEYQSLNIKEHLINLCKTEKEIERINYEISVFEKRDLLKLLQFIKYLVDIMRENNIVWGVGRGSSVCSYALYLLGIHKINSIKYDLNFDEFLN